MSVRVPRWFRERCTHPDRTAISNALGTVLRDYCPDCGAQFGPPSSPSAPVRGE
jgi:hypothetical protein